MMRWTRNLVLVLAGVAKEVGVRQKVRKPESEPVMRVWFVCVLGTYYCIDVLA